MMKLLLLVVLAVLPVALAHVRINSVNSVDGSESSRNEGSFDASGRPCGTNDDLGSNGFTEYYPGATLNLEFEMNSHPPLGEWQIRFAPTGEPSEFEVQDNFLGTQPNTGQGVYTQTVTLPNQICDACSVQVWTEGHDWGSCHDIRIVRAPCPGSCAETGLIENGEFDPETGTVTCNEGYEFDEESGCNKNGMNAAAATFLALFVILVVVALVITGLVIAHKLDKLPPAIDGPVGKATDATTNAFKKITHRGGNSSPGSAPLTQQQPPSQTPSPQYSAQPIPPPRQAPVSPTRAAPLPPARAAPSTPARPPRGY